MGSLLSAKREEEQMLVEVRIPKEEIVQLQGHVDDVHVFSEKVADIRTNVAMRGKNAATKYFLIPRELRRNLKFNKEVRCQRINADGKAIFVYVIDQTKPGW